MNRSKKRDGVLDFYRGIAAISIILIHTVYWSGTSYTPEILKTIVLLLDVPFFIFLSGWSFQYDHQIQKIFWRNLSIWVKWGIYLLILNTIEYLVFDYPMTMVRLVRQFFFFQGDYGLRFFRVAASSGWFLPMFFRVTLLGALIVCFIERFSIRGGISGVLSFLIIGCAYLSFPENTSWFLITRQTCMYLPFWILGYYSHRWSIVRKRDFVVGLVVIFAVWICCSKGYGIPFGDLQSAKFPPHIMYVAASMLSIWCAVFFRPFMKPIAQASIWLQYIGKNALYFYFAQGIGASLLFVIIPLYSELPWSEKALLSFLLNLLISFVCGFILVLGYGMLDGIAKRLQFKGNRMKQAFTKRDEKSEQIQ